MSRNGVASNEPFLTIRIRPPFSTMNRRFVPSRGLVTSTGWVTLATLTSDTVAEVGVAAWISPSAMGEGATDPAAAGGSDAAMIIATTAAMRRWRGRRVLERVIGLPVREVGFRPGRPTWRGESWGPPRDLSTPRSR